MRRKTARLSCFLSLILLGVSACSFPNHQNFEARLHSFIGSSSDTILETLGPPVRTMSLSGGRTAWFYSHKNTSYVGSSNSYQPFGGTDYFNQTNTSTSIIAVHQNCDWWFVFSSSHIVQKVGDHGNACIADKPAKATPLHRRDAPSISKNGEWRDVTSKYPGAVGKNIGVVIKAVGQPSDIRKTSGGWTVYLWNFSTSSGPPCATAFGTKSDGIVSMVAETGFCEASVSPSK